MYYQVCAFLLLDVLEKENCGLTVTKLADLCNIDKTSENLRSIRDECWDFVEVGICYASDYRNQKSGDLFFSLI